jgi:transcription initiation factor TFIIE subunit alpha
MDIVLKLLTQTVRCFYDAKSVIIYDLLIKNTILSDEDLALALKDKSKEVNKVCYKLRADGMVRVESRWEALENDYKKRSKTSKSYYFVDYALALNSIKYKIYKIGKIIEKQVQDQMNNMPFICSPCNREFQTLDMLTLETNADKIPLCDYCHGELYLDQKKEASKENSEKFIKFMNQCKPIVDMLKLTDSLIIPE